MQRQEDKGDWSCVKCCVKCSVQVKQIVPCQHCICVKCSETLLAETQNSTDVITCPSCQASGHFSDQGSELCKHDKKRSSFCLHCHKTVCRKCMNTHKVIVQSDINKLIQEWNEVQRRVGGFIDARLVRKRNEQNLDEFSGHFTEQIDKIASSLQLKLTSVHDEIMAQKRCQLEKSIAEVKQKRGDFAVTDKVIRDLSDLTSFAAMPFHEVIKNFELLKNTLESARSVSNEAIESQLSLLLGSEMLTLDSGKLENLTKTITVSLLNGSSKAESSPKPTAESPKQPPVPPEQVDSKRPRISMALNIIGLPFKFDHPWKVAFFNELGPDRFVVIHNFKFISIVELASFRLLHAFDTKPTGNGGCLSGDIAYFEGVFYFTNKKRRKIFQLALDYSALIKVVPRLICLNLERLNINRDQIFGLEVSKATRQLIFSTQSSIVFVSVDNLLRIRVISPPWLNQSPFYLKDISQNSLLLMQFNKVYLCKFVISNGIIYLDDNLQRPFQIKKNKNFSTFRSCAFDPAGNIIGIGKGGLLVVKSDGTPVTSFVPAENGGPDLTSANVAVGLTSSSLVILTCESDKNRLVSITQDK